MNLITVGCSFTYGLPPTGSWPAILAKKLSDKYQITVDLNNQGHGGAGNTYIANKFPLFHTEAPLWRPDLVVVMWSGLTRKDITVDRSDEILMNALSDYKDYVRWAGPHTSYILSGGIEGTWQHHPLTKEIFSPLYKVSNERTMAQDTLLNIISLQNYLKQRGISYIMSSYVNYWTADDIVAQLDYGIGKFSDLRRLVSQIDFTKWAFVNDKKDCIYELAKETPNGLDTDGFHPTVPVYELWANILMDKIEKDNYFKTEKQC